MMKKIVKSVLAGFEDAIAHAKGDKSKGILTTYSSLTAKATPEKRFKGILVAEIQKISNHGLWVFVKDREFFIPFTKYPWFKQAAIDQIYDFECLHGKHLHWPTLDVDVEIDALENPDAYPLIYKK